MTAAMKLDAVDVLRRGMKSGTVHNGLVLLRDYFQENYTGYRWHAVDYNSYAIHYSKYVTLKIDGKTNVVLFANKI